MLIDFHSHILPGIDDGAANIEESIKILTMLKNQGVDIVVATPHFYNGSNKIDTFIEKRNYSYNSLMERIMNDNISVPEIKLGAEVYLSYEIAANNDLEKLCIGDTKCILIEMPYSFWFDWTYDIVNSIIVDRGLTPIIAHLERYSIMPKEMKKFDKLLEQEVYVQINTDSVTNRKLWKIIKILLDKNCVHVIGSDTHNVTNRKPQFASASKKIIKHFGVHKWDYLLENANKLLGLQ